MSELSIFIRPSASLRRGRRSGRGCRARLSRDGFTNEAADFELKPGDVLRIVICHSSLAFRFPNMSQSAIGRSIEFEYKEKEKGKRQWSGDDEG